MYATATTHLPHPLGTVVETVFGDDAPVEEWLPELRRVGGDRLDRVGARAELALGLPGWPERIDVATERVVRTTVTAGGRTADGREARVCVSLSPWDGGTAVVVSIDTGDEPRPLLTWALTRRLEAALVRLAGQLATAVSPVAPARP